MNKSDKFSSGLNKVVISDLSIQRTAQYTHAERNSGRDVLQRIYLDNGTKVNNDAFEISISGVNVISFANRHTITGLLKNKGGAKEINTVLLKPVEMRLVANDAYDFAWDSDKDKLSVTDGSSFVSCGVKWGIDARPNGNPPGIHIYPVEGGQKAINIGKEISALRCYLTMLDKNKTKKEALIQASNICKKTGGDLTKMHIVIIALNRMGEV